MKAADARVVLTGACGGIGRASAEALLREGASLMLVGRSPHRLAVGSSRVDLQACKLEYSIVSPK